MLVQSLMGRVLGVAGICLFVVAITAALQQSASATCSPCANTCFPNATIVPNVSPIEYECGGGGGCAGFLCPDDCSCEVDASQTLCSSMN